MIESSSGRYFMCAYEPRTKEAFSSCTSASPEYDLEVSAKIILSRLPNSKADQNSSFQILVGVKSPLEYLAVKCDLSTQSWVLVKIRNGEEYVEEQFSDGEIKANTFYTLLIQIRGTSISVDIDGVPVFTSIRLTSGESLSGLLGLMAKVIINFSRGQFLPFHSPLAQFYNCSHSELCRILVIEIRHQGLEDSGRKLIEARFCCFIDRRASQPHQRYSFTSRGQCWAVGRSHW